MVEEPKSSDSAVGRREGNSMKDSETVKLSSLKNINYLCENDLYTLAKLADTVMNMNNRYPNSTSFLTIHGLAAKYSSLDLGIESHIVEKFLNKNGFDSRKSIINDENTHTK